MDINDMVLVSVDDHVVEPPHLFEGRLPAKYVDLAPQFITRDDGTNAWLYEGQEIANVALNAVAGRPKEEYGMEPTSFTELRAGCYDIDQRVKDMDANGVLGSLCFPSFPQFCGQLFARTEDKDVALAMVRAYNDWHIDDWCGTHPGRFIPCSLPAIWDPEVLAAEVRRTAAKGAHAVTFSENPSKLGWPSIHSDHWDPFWQACSDEQVVVCMHIGSSSSLVITSPDAPIDCLITLTPINIVQAATDIIWSGVLSRFPDLRIALSEGGIGWIPYFLERIDYQYRQHHFWTGQDFGDRLPSEVFSERVLTCFIDDRFGVANRTLPQHGQRDVGVRLPALRLDVAVLARAGRRALRRRRQRPRHRPHHPPQRHEPLQLRPVRDAGRPRELHGGRAARPGRGPRRGDPVGAARHGRPARHPGGRPGGARQLSRARPSAQSGAPRRGMTFEAMSSRLSQARSGSSPPISGCSISEPVSRTRATHSSGVSTT